MNTQRSSLFSFGRKLRYGGTPHGGKKTERTLAFTFGPWGGVWFTGSSYCWRLCLGFVALTYIREEMTVLLAALNGDHE